MRQRVGFRATKRNRSTFGLEWCNLLVCKHLEKRLQNLVATVIAQKAMPITYDNVRYDRYALGGTRTHVSEIAEIRLLVASC